MLRKDLQGKIKSINHAIRIIGEGLRESLDKNVGGKLALDLDAIYDYMCRRLVVANANNDIEILDEVTRLLSELKGAWDSIRPAISASAPALNASSPAAVLPPQQQAAMKKPQPLVYGRG
jgi:flagellar protein FliS